MLPIPILRPEHFAEPADRVRALEDLVRRVEALPGIDEAGLGSNGPFLHDDGFRTVGDIDGADPTATLSADLREVSANYFQLLKIPLVRGRSFAEADDRSAPAVSIVNEAVARKLAPQGEVLGRRLDLGFRGTYEIVGVAADARSSGETVDVWDEVYIPFRQTIPSLLYLIVRSRLDAATLDASLRRELRAVMPQVPDDPVLTTTAMDDLVRRSLARPRFSATLIGAFALNALLLSAIGVFGLMAYSVSGRRREIGVRAALGANPGNLLRMTLRSTIGWTLIGLGGGLAAAAYLTRLVESQLYAIQPLDVPTFVGAALLMAAVAGLAAYVPARRASRISPAIVLRQD